MRGAITNRAGLGSRELSTVRRSDLAAAVHDFLQSLFALHLWPMLSWQEIRQRYRRSTLGPFWLTLSTGAMIAGMGPLYGQLLNQDVSTYISFLAVGIIVWQLMALIINEACAVFIGADQFLKQVRLPLFIHVFRMVARNAIIFAHNFVVIVVVFLLVPVKPTWHCVWAIFGLLAILVNGLWIGALLGLISARFRDVPQIVSSLVTIAFFLTPVMWSKSMLGKTQWAADLNPFYHFLDVVRTPLLGQPPSLRSWLAILAVTVVGFTVTFVLFARYRTRIAYWL